MLLATPPTICLSTFALLILHCAFVDNYLMTLISLGDTECAQQILQGTYDYPLDTNIWTKKILQEAHYTFSQMSGAETTMTITTKDFQNFWQQVHERSSSSFIGITFSHCKAAALTFNILSLNYPCFTKY
jgi:hypothetical protein